MGLRVESEKRRSTIPTSLLVVILTVCLVENKESKVEENEVLRQFVALLPPSILPFSDFLLSSPFFLSYY